MKSNGLLLGSHISLNRQSGYLVGVVEESIHNGADTFMIFTGAPHNKKRVPIDQLRLKEAQELGAKHGILFSNAVVHAPYIINLSNPIEDNEKFNIEHMEQEVRRTQAMGIPYIVLHPGYHIDQTREEGIERLIKNLRKVLERIEDVPGVTICLETMPGKRNQLGRSFEELAEIIGGCGNHPKLGVCLDTVHMNDAGYDLSKKEKIFRRIEETLGWDRIKVLHLGDSTGKIGSNRDRHANFNYGTIGFDTLLSWAYDEKFRGIPIIVETPFWLSKKNPKVTASPYRHEIKLIRQRRWEPIPEEGGFKPRQ